MAQFYCEVCNQRITTSNTNTDVVHDCGDFPENTTTGFEDIVFPQTSAEDFDGTHTQGPQQAMLRGIQNKMIGTRAGVEGNKDFDRTARGNNANVVRTRRRFTYHDTTK